MHSVRLVVALHKLGQAVRTAATKHKLLKDASPQGGLSKKHKIKNLYQQYVSSNSHLHNIL